MAKSSQNVITEKRYYVPSWELYNLGAKNSIVPAFNNLYDVWIDFNTTSGNLKNFLNQHRPNTTSNPGDYMALFCSQAVLPGSDLQVGEARGLRQGVVSKYAYYRQFPDIQLVFFTQQDYYTNDLFNAWLEFISPTYIAGGGHGSSTRERIDATASYRKMKYPEEYKCNVQISAFSREAFSDSNKLIIQANQDFDTVEANLSVPPSTITYNLTGAFPRSVVSAPLQYGGAQLIQTTVNLTYENYYVDRISYEGDTKKFESDVTAVRNPFA